MNEALIKSVCWTLVHSLWIGLVAAAVGGVIIGLTQRTPSFLRYNLLLLTGSLFILAICCVFYWQQTIHTPVAQLHEARMASGHNAEPVLVSPVAEVQQQRQSVLERAAGFLNSNATEVVLSWFVLFILKLAGMVNAFRHIYRVRSSSLNATPLNWNGKARHLSMLLGIKRMVRVVETPLVKVPSVIGYFKPIIFVPVGLLANLPADEAEAILLHELAHIRRKDFLVNLIQYFVEAVFFFNPGIVWLSSQLKTERENCCDDMAIAITQNKTGFVKALVSSGIYDNSPALALKFGNKKTHVLDRAKRILLNNNKSLNTMEKTIISVGIVATIGLAMAFSTGNDDKKTVKGQKPYVATVKTSQGKVYTVFFKQDPDSIKKKERKEKVDKKSQERAEEEMKLEMERQRQQMEQARLDMEKVRLEMERARINMSETDWDKMREELRKAELEMKKVDWDEVNKQLEEAQRELANVDWADVEKELRQAGIEMKNAQEEITNAKKEVKNAEKEMELAAIEMKRAEEERKEVEKMDEELKKDAGVSEIKSFLLDKEQLIVNGKKMPDEVHKKYKNKYLKDGKGVMCRSCTISHGKVTMHN